MSTYFTVSCLYWYMGMIPDLGTLRDRAVKTWRKYFYGVLAMGWRSSTSALAQLAKWLYLLLARLFRRRWCCRCTRSCPSTSRRLILPGWHTTIFPPYFVA